MIYHNFYISGVELSTGGKRDDKVFEARLETAGNLGPR